MNDVVGLFLQKKRIEAVFPHIRGRLLDVGCGNNRLVKQYKNGVGVDVFKWEGVDVLVEDTSKLPFKDGEFDTVTILAALNHIPNRDAVLLECKRMLSKDGYLVMTMIPPFISSVWHKIREPWDEDQHVRGMEEGEVFGFTKSQMVEMCNSAGFELVSAKSFTLVNKVYIFKKKL